MENKIKDYNYIFDNINLQKNIELSNLHDLTIIDSSSLFLNNKNLIDLMKNKKNIIFLNDKLWLEKTFTDLSKIKLQFNETQLINHEELSKYIDKIFTNKSIYNFEDFSNAFMIKYNKDLKNIYKHFKKEFLTVDSINLSWRIINTTDYIKTLEIMENDNTYRYDLIEKINQVISAIMLITIENIKNNNLQQFNYYINYNTDYSSKKEEINSLKKDLVNIDMIKSVIVIFYNNVKQIIENLLSKEHVYNLFSSYFLWLNTLLFNELKKTGVLSQITWEDMDTLESFVQDIENIDPIPYYNNYNKYPFLYSNVEQINNLITEHILKTFFIMINNFQNKLSFSFFEFGLDYKKNLITYLYLIFSWNKIDNYTLSFWDEQIFNDFLLNFIKIKE